MRIRRSSGGGNYSNRQQVTQQQPQRQNVQQKPKTVNATPSHSTAPTKTTPNSTVSSNTPSHLSKLPVQLPNQSSPTKNAVTPKNTINSNEALSKYYASDDYKNLPSQYKQDIRGHYDRYKNYMDNRVTRVKEGDGDWQTPEQLYHSGVNSTLSQYDKSMGQTAGPTAPSKLAGVEPKNNASQKDTVKSTTPDDTKNNNTSATSKTGNMFSSLVSGFSDVVSGKTKDGAMSGLVDNIKRQNGLTPNEQEMSALKRLDGYLTPNKFGESIGPEHADAIGRGVIATDPNGFLNHPQTRAQMSQGVESGIQNYASERFIGGGRMLLRMGSPMAWNKARQEGWSRATGQALQQGPSAIANEYRNGLAKSGIQNTGKPIDNTPRNLTMADLNQFQQDTATLKGMQSRLGKQTRELLGGYYEAPNGLNKKMVQDLVAGKVPEGAKWFDAGIEKSTLYPDATASQRPLIQGADGKQYYLPQGQILQQGQKVLARNQQNQLVPVDPLNPQKNHQVAYYNIDANHYAYGQPFGQNAKQVIANNNNNDAEKSLLGSYLNAFSLK